MSTIYIKDLIIEAKHGIHEHEKAQPQRFIINLELTVDLTRAAASDDLADTLNYSELKQTIIDVTQNNSFNLIERLAGAIADRLLADKRIQKLNLSIDKPDAFKTGRPGIRLEITP
jgi:7,8-dihydroneopterin aldolase/epimerase/oxygenase